MKVQMNVNVMIIEYILMLQLIYFIAAISSN